VSDGWRGGRLLSQALSRKNALFASLVETCKFNGVDPHRYFSNVLTRLVNGWPNSRIDELMPWCWTASRRI
jgi:transposase